jgi:peptidoglycan/LPS O-acetylase OafA/YrhL
MEGLILGFFAAYLPHYRPSIFAQVQQWCGKLFWPSCIILAMLPFWSEALMYQLGLSVLAVTLCVILIALEGREPGRLARSRIVYWIAVTSYSVYLTHTLMIHLATLAVEQLGLPEYLFYVLASTAIVLTGAVFYLACERLSIAIRERVVPRRKTTMALAA